MSVTRDTSHSAIAPCGLSEPSPFGSLTHALTALLSSALDKNTVHTVRDIDPNFVNLLMWEEDVGEKITHEVARLYMQNRPFTHA